jgi:hypothetical protein
MLCIGKQARVVGRVEGDCGRHARGRGVRRCVWMTTRLGAGIGKWSGAGVGGMEKVRGVSGVPVAAESCGNGPKTSRGRLTNSPRVGGCRPRQDRTLRTVLPQQSKYAHA